MAERAWSEKDLVRRANRRLAVFRHEEDVSGSVAGTCRYYGISRKIFYRWKRRYEDEGLEGLNDRSNAPMHSLNVTHPEVVGKVIHLREHYHFGPRNLSTWMRRRLSVITVWWLRPWGGLIHELVGIFGGWGGLRTNRSGLAW